MASEAIKMAASGKMQRDLRAIEVLYIKYES